LSYIEDIPHLLARYFEDGLEETPLREEDYVIDEDGLVQVNTHCALSKTPPGGRLPVEFSHAGGDFIVAGKRIKNLEGCPTTVEGNFDCSHNGLTTLRFAPTRVWDMDCSFNQLSSLEYCPAVPRGELLIHNNLFTRLATVPPCRFLYATFNPIQGFADLPNHIGHIQVSYTPDLPLLGLLKIKEIWISDQEGRRLEDLEQILNCYAGQGEAGAFACGAELASAGYKENAKW